MHRSTPRHHEHETSKSTGPQRAYSSHLLVVRRRIPLRPCGSIPVRLTPLEALGRELVRRKAAGAWGKAAGDDDGLFAVPRLVVRHDPIRHQIRRSRQHMSEASASHDMCGTCKFHASKIQLCSVRTVIRRKLAHCVWSFSGDAKQYA